MSDFFCNHVLAHRSIDPAQHFLAHKIEENLYRQSQALGRSFKNVLLLNAPAGKLDAYFPHAQSYQKVERTALSYDNGTFDLVLDCMSWHWINDLPQALMEVKRIMAPGAVYLSGFLGEKTLTELRQVLLATDMTFFDGAAQRVAPMAQAQTLGELLLACGFEDPILDLQSLEVHYKDLRHLLGDLKIMGERGYLKRQETTMPTLRPSYLRYAQDLYRNLFPANDHGIKTTFDIIYGTMTNSLKEL